MKTFRIILVSCLAITSVAAVYIFVRPYDECVATDQSFQLPPRDTTEIRFAVIGDYGHYGDDEAAVANLINSWEPDFIITVGDNNYDNGEAATLDENVGFYFGDYIDADRFFPALGNHDWRSDINSAYLAYFELPGNERYYTFTRGPVQFFVLDSDQEEPDGVSADSVQAEWLRDELLASTSSFQVVYFHHPPYSSGIHGSSDYMRWDFAAWGADAILSGHDHSYERIAGPDGIPYFVNGLGGHSIRSFRGKVDGSQVRFNCAYGAMLVDANKGSMTFYFVTTDGLLVDEFVIHVPDNR